MKAVSGTLKLDLAQFRELEAFATFGSELDAVSRAQLDRGARLVELLKQPLNSPMPVEEQVVAIYAGTSGTLDDVPVTDVRRFESELLEYFRTRRVDLLDQIRASGALPEGDALAAAVSDFKAGFVTTDGTTPGAADVAGSDAESVGEPTSDETLQTE
jgi:F-type H+-transporting ATPase subunit alpha